MSLNHKTNKTFLIWWLENQYKVLSAEDLKKRSDNAENSWKISIKKFLCLFLLCLKFEWDHKEFL